MKRLGILTAVCVALLCVGTPYSFFAVLRDPDRSLMVYALIFGPFLPPLILSIAYFWYVRLRGYAASWIVIPGAVAMIVQVLFIVLMAFMHTRFPEGPHGGGDAGVILFPWAVAALIAGVFSVGWLACAVSHVKGVFPPEKKSIYDS